MCIGSNLLPIIRFSQQQEGKRRRTKNAGKNSAKDKTQNEDLKKNKFAVEKGAAHTKKTTPAPESVTTLNKETKKDENNEKTNESQESSLRTGQNQSIQKSVEQFVEDQKTVDD